MSTVPTVSGKRERQRNDILTSAERAEKRQRREEKRARKEARRKRRAERQEAKGAHGVVKERGGDSAESSDEKGGAQSRPDSNVFVWKKKNELLRKQGIKVTVEDEQRRRQEIEEDLERAKVRREQREAERAEWEEEKAKLAREREQEQNADWHRGEESFHGTQHFLRQAIRLRENRATDADALARNVRLDLLDVSADSRSPAELLDDRVAEGLSAEAVSELVEAVENELDCTPDFPVEDDTPHFNRQLRLRWWSNVRTFLTELARTLSERDRSKATGKSNLQSSVQRDVDTLLEKKTKDDLEKMEQEISRRLKGGESDAAYGEVDFWDAALRTIHSRLARTELQELTTSFAKERLRLRAARPESNPSEGPHRGGSRADGSSSNADDRLLNAEMERGLGVDEEAFSEEAVVPAKKDYVPGYLWNEKYRPRKPRYYNRVHTGYDWTKYNRTHYDHNNPPPKTVQGYKFNIFYPDLIDRTITPKYALSKTENPEVSILTFSAGPPYEDIAFKIVNRQWEQSHRRGYRCSFDRGVLHLWFNFQRYRYRR